MQNVMNTLNLISHPNTHHNYHHIHELSSCLCMVFIEGLFLIIILLYPYLSDQCSLVLFTNIIAHNLRSQGNLALKENSPFLTMCIYEIKKNSYLSRVSVGSTAPCGPPCANKIIGLLLARYLYSGRMAYYGASR